MGFQLMACVVRSIGIAISEFQVKSRSQSRVKVIFCKIQVYSSLVYKSRCFFPLEASISYSTAGLVFKSFLPAFSCRPVPPWRLGIPSLGSC